mmetsp:Transcript_5721/g.21703  ORF Transcript_5721/g.21703 Transcript_5721/m.21703 type:complete len:452 (-) Transcript_5721:180-1535(-)
MATEFFRESWVLASFFSVVTLLALTAVGLVAKALLGHLGTASTAIGVYLVCSLLYVLARSVIRNTALLHFLLVECWPIALAAISFNKIVVDVNVHVALAQANFSTGALYGYYQQRYLWPGYVPGMNYTFGGTLELPEVTWGTLPAPDWFWLLSEWGFYVSVLLLTFYVLKEFFHDDAGKPNLFAHSFEDGAYLSFTWRLPRLKGYRKIIWTMAFFAIALPFVWVVELLFLFGDGYMQLKDVGTQITILLDTTWTTGIALVLALLRLGKFRLGGRRFLDDAPLVWHERDAPAFLGDFAVNRYASLACGLPGIMSAFEGNAAFGAKFLDAVWQAKHGRPELLRKSLQRGPSSDHWQQFLEAASAVAQQAPEDRRRDANEDGDVSMDEVGEGSSVAGSSGSDRDEGRARRRQPQEGARASAGAGLPPPPAAGLEEGRRAAASASTMERELATTE